MARRFKNIKLNMNRLKRMLINTIISSLLITGLYKGIIYYLTDTIQNKLVLTSHLKETKNNKEFEETENTNLENQVIPIKQSLPINGIVNRAIKDPREVIDDIHKRIIDRAIEHNYLNDNPDILDMPPWKNENKWHKISNKKLTCWYHKKSKKKVCEENHDR